MSEEGEKTCPLCAEEMDLTDQQLKPCKCGYEICVWCWHHIMEMAEKNESEGRCPACRNPYNKEKIVGTSASCERLVSEMNVDKKMKSQKGRSKTSEGRKQLASVRVIQRNLVYVVGLPLNFADEDLLQRRDYFAQYGKVLKASMSRTAGGAIQQFPNSTCSVYITYSKEEEAVRCIQSVHGFVLDGRPLRASFGTTKYCHAWLRHMPCSNPDCLYLHEIGSTDDSFTKDEIISAYTRNRVQQLTGSTNSLQRRSGNVLPPPLDDYCNNSSASSGKPITKTAVNANSNSVISARVSPPSSSSGRSAALPAGASWGTRSSNNQTSHTSMPSSNGSLKQESDALTGAVPCSSAVSSLTKASTLHSDSGKMLVTNDENTTFPDEVESLESPREESNTAERVNASDCSFASVQSCSTPITRQPITRQSCSTPITRQPHDPPAKELPPSSTNIIDSPSMPGGSVLNKDSVDALDENMENICSDILSMSVHENQQFQNIYPEHRRELLVSGQSGKAAITTDEMCASSVQSDFRGGMPAEETQVNFDETEDDLLAFNNQRLKDPEVITNRTLDFSNPVHLLKHSSQFNNDNGTIGNDFNWQFVDRESSRSVSTNNFPSGHLTNMLSSPEVNDSRYSNIFPRQEKKSLLGRYEGDVASGSFDMGESSIISNMFSMDFDPWNEAVSSPQNLGKILGETDERQGSFGMPGSWKSQNSNQSRFSFAREEEPMSQQSSFVKSNGYLGQGLKQHPFNCDFSGSTGLHLEKFASRNGFLVLNGMESDTLPSSHSHISSNKLSISRSQMSAPPGFSQPSRAAPPPGFSSHERTDQIFDTFSRNHMHDSSGLLRNQYQTPQSSNSINNGDIELIDPAIMAVGKGTLPGGMHNSGLDIRSNFSPQLSAYEDSRFQSFLQTSLPSHHNQRFGDSFSPFSDTFGIPQTLANDLSHFSQFNLSQHRNGVTSNGQWDGNNLGMPELLRTERLGFNKFYGGYEDSKTRMPSSGNLYNGTYGI